MTVSEDETAKGEAYDKRPFIQNLAQGAALGLSAKLGLQSDWAVLDFGCGTGLVLDRVAIESKSLKTVTACCAQLTKPESLREHFVQHNVSGDIPTQFDLIYLSMTLHHIDNIPALVKLLKSYLKPKGDLAAFDLEKDPDSMLFHPQPISPSVDHPGGFSADNLCEIWKAAGLSAVSCEQVHRLKKEVDVDGQPKSVPLWMLMVKGCLE